MEVMLNDVIERFTQYDWELQPFRKTLPRNKDVNFKFQTTYFDVSKAYFLFQYFKYELIKTPINVTEVATAADLTYTRYTDKCLSRFTGAEFGDFINEKYLKQHLAIEDKQIDLEEPLFFVLHRPEFCEDSQTLNKDKTVYRLLINGNHRLRKAYLLGIKTLPAYTFNEVQTEFIKFKYRDKPKLTDSKRRRKPAEYDSIPFI